MAGMKTPAGNIPLILPAALLAEVEAAADEEHRPVAEVLRDLVERGLGMRRWQARAEKERQRARELGLPEDDGPTTDEYRQTLCRKIAQGVQSLREGKLTDGKKFTAQMDVELALLERQGQE
jgi:hypothetical protein